MPNNNRHARCPWSSAEEEWLSQHKTYPITQLSTALNRSFTAVKRKIAELSGKSVKSPKKKQISKIGRRKDCNNIFFRSVSEANFYRYLQTLPNVKIIEVEPTTFSFAPFGILKGTISYTPDFKITFNNGDYLWIEVKGWLRPQDKTKINRFKKYYPEEYQKFQTVPMSKTCATGRWFIEKNIPIFVCYNDINKKYKNKIKGWE